MKPPKKAVKPPNLREDRATAEAAARDYRDRYRSVDRFLETSLRASYDGKTWAIVAHVDDPGRCEEVEIQFGASILKASMPAFPPQHMEHRVILVKRR